LDRLAVRNSLGSCAACMPEELIDRDRSVRGRDDAARDPDGSVAILDREWLGDGGHYPGGRDRGVGRLVQRGERDHNRVLIEGGRQVARANCPAHALRALPQHLVSDALAIGPRHDLPTQGEPVQADPPPLALGERERAPQVVAEEGFDGETGERID
jgi:hypothetical protein